MSKGMGMGKIVGDSQLALYTDRVPSVPMVGVPSLAFVSIFIQFVCLVLGGLS